MKVLKIRVLIHLLFLGLISPLLLILFGRVAVYHLGNPVIDADPRVDARLAAPLIIQPQTQQASFFFSMDPLKPHFQVGFERPSSFPLIILKQSSFQIVRSFHSVAAPPMVNEKILNHSVIFTYDPLVFARYKNDYAHLKFLPSRLEVLQALNREKEAFGFMHPEDITPDVRVLSKPVRVRLWAGGRRGPSRVLNYLGLNRKFDEMVYDRCRPINLISKHRFHTLLAVGDIMMARTVEKRFLKEMQKIPSTSYPFQDTMDLLKTADIAVGNLECALSNVGEPMPQKDYTFRAGPALLSSVRSAGFRLVSLANNHSKDFGEEALLDTVKRLHQAGIATVGAGGNRTAARAPAFLTLDDGTRIGFLAYSMVVPKDFLADDRHPGIASAKNPKPIENEIRSTKSLCDILVVQYHWGKEYTQNPTREQQDLGRKSIDWGADVVIGHHPHWIQGIEFYKKGFIAYSLGNFVFDMTHRPKVTEGMILRCLFQDKQLIQVFFDPITIHNGQPEPTTWEQGHRNRLAILKEIWSASGF